LFRELVGVRRFERAPGNGQTEIDVRPQGGAGQSLPCGAHRPLAQPLPRSLAEYTRHSATTVPSAMPGQAGVVLKGVADEPRLGSRPGFSAILGHEPGKVGT